MPDAAGRESSAQLVNRRFRGDYWRIAAHHRADQQLVDPPHIFRTADRQTAQMKAPGRKRIAEPMPHHYRGRDDPDHDTDSRREVAGCFEHYHDHRHRGTDDGGGNRTHADHCVDQRVDPEIWAQPGQCYAGQAAEQAA